MKVVLGGLKDRAEELQSFLEPRVGAKPSVSGGELEMEDSAIRKGVKPRQVKTYVKRFLHQKGLRKTFRVLVNGSQLTIQELEVEEGEEKEKKEKEKEAPKKREDEAGPKKEEEGKEEVMKKEAPQAPEKKEGGEEKEKQKAKPKQKAKSAPKGKKKSEKKKS